MLNQTGVERKEYGISSSMLEDTNMRFSMSCKVQPTGDEEPNEYGYKVIHAGMPLYGDLTKRDETPFKTSGDGKPAGLLFSDVDVTATTTKATVNASILVWGIVNEDRVAEDVATKLEEVKENLPPTITVVK